ncbi:hypothetical protein HLK59_11525 [Streptomyces sp. S3(2020)]|uniref:hypothetical protein n=1 Tax=Streptomyces sp. S3(2020) TaxID=2732044 RepID=UPI001489DA08|nr:hypothetical protein [Streptomyces sp. S3(2020)]NNN30989.1 hypothetical protein [Streptomyces sp. S3(2020)]
MNDEITTTVGHQLFSFDGRILEIFGNYPKRWHIRHMSLRITGPDRKGRRTVEIDAPGTRTTWDYTAAEWEQAPGLVALLEAVQAAIDANSGHGNV